MMQLLTSQKPMCGLDPKQWSALVQASNWWTKMRFAAVYSFHAGQKWGEMRGELGKGE